MPYYESSPSNRSSNRQSGYSSSSQQFRGDQPRYQSMAPDLYSAPLMQGGYYNTSYSQQDPMQVNINQFAYSSSSWAPSRSSSTYCPPSGSPPMLPQSSYSHSPRYEDSPPPCGTTTEAINANAPSGHRIKELTVSTENKRQYMQRPSKQDCENGWRPGHYKCVFPGCTSNAVEEHRVQMHLSLHIHSKKAYECDCGTRFGRLSEANRHLEDQNPCRIW
ncbi:hypothetical protein BU17DRAFT_102519 [Hysterangium stoloniferum]|nr:hypothetical protein BU17DRAFT_102519 [Hysterangium stoloniferum]